MNALDDFHAFPSCALLMPSFLFLVPFSYDILFYPLTVASGLLVLPINNYIDHTHVFPIPSFPLLSLLLIRYVPL